MTDQSNMQKMHIPSEWVETALLAYNSNYAVRHEGLKAAPGGIQAAIAAVIPLIREDERERLAGIAEGEGRWLDEETRLDDWLRTQEGK